MTGRDDNASFTELQALTSRLEDVKRIVRDQMVRKLHSGVVGIMKLLPSPIIENSQTFCLTIPEEDNATRRS